MAIIYLITNKINSKRYVGFTNYTIDRRFKEHVRNALSKNIDTPLYRSMRKYGSEQFMIRILFKSELADYTLNVMEGKFILLYDTLRYGYNCTMGGEGSNMRRLSESQLIHLRTVNIGRKQSPEQIKSRVDKNKGKVRTADQKRKYSEANSRRVKDGSHNFQKNKGAVWITKNGIDIRISKLELDNYMIDGWERGRSSLSKRIWVNNSISEKMIDSAEVIDRNWSKGRLTKPPSI